MVSPALPPGHLSPKGSLPQSVAVTPARWPGLPPEQRVTSPQRPGPGWAQAAGSHRVCRAHRAAARPPVPFLCCFWWRQWGPLGGGWRWSGKARKRRHISRGLGRGARCLIPPGRHQGCPQVWPSPALPTPGGPGLGACSKRLWGLSPNSFN